MPANTFVQEFVERNYSFQPVSVEQLRFDQAQSRALYRVDDVAGEAWMLRLQRHEQPVPSWFGGGSAVDWLQERATVLVWLTQHRYPAPQVMPTHAHALVSTYENWCGILTSFVAGTALSTTSDHLALLAATLGHLHTTGLPHQAHHTSLMVNSWWHPLDRAVTYALQHLPPARSVPYAWQPLHATCETALHAINRSLDLPTTCIHGDCWTGNAILGSDGQVHLIDWDASGLGYAVLDVGAILGDCFRYPAERVAPEPAWVHAVVDGYMRARTLAAEERALLPHAIPFGAAFRTAIRFALAEQYGWSAGVIRGLEREQARLAASSGIAALATARFTAQA